MVNLQKKQVIKIIDIDSNEIEKEKRKSLENNFSEKIGNDFPIPTKLKLNLNAKPIHFLKNKIVQYEDPNEQSNF